MFVLPLLLLMLLLQLVGQLQSLAFAAKFAFAAQAVGSNLQIRLELAANKTNKRAPASKAGEANTKRRKHCTALHRTQLNSAQLAPNLSPVSQATGWPRKQVSMRRPLSLSVQLPPFWLTSRSPVSVSSSRRLSAQSRQRQNTTTFAEENNISSETHASKRPTCPARV